MITASENGVLPGVGALRTVVAARLTGADRLISGIRPQIAQTIVALGIEFRRHRHQGRPRRHAPAEIHDDVAVLALRRR